MFTLWHCSWPISVTRLGSTQKFTTMKEITIKNLSQMREQLSDALINKKSYTLTDPSKLIDIIDSYVQVRQERDSYSSEREKLIKILETLQCMAEAVQGIMEND